MKKATVLLFLVVTARIRGQSPLQRPECTGIIHGIVYALSGQPAPGVKLSAVPLGVDMAVFLPTVKSDQSGEYRFEHLCRGQYAVVPDDPTAGYPVASPYLNEFLYGTRMIAVRLNWLHRRAELPVHLPPKPGSMLLHVRDSKTNTEIRKLKARLRVPGQRRFPEISFECDDNGRDCRYLVPPDKNVILLVNVEGYKEITRSISVVAGTQTILDLNVERLN